MANSEANKVRIAVSGVGGGVGQSIIKSLQNTNYEVVGLDSEVLGAGLYATSKSYVIPYASHPAYIDRVIEICVAEGCQLFFPGLDAELPILSESVSKFSEKGILVVISSPDVVALSDNKMLTYTQLKQYGIAVPKTIDMSERPTTELPLSLPFILKKKVGGARSQDVHLIKTENDWDSLVKSGADLRIFVAQQYIEGDEYTCGTINLDGECKGVIVMRRVLRDGDTYKSFSEDNPVIEAEVRKVMSAIKPFGACNVQLRLKDGKPYVFEINARCSGTTAARTLCGFNEPRMIADYLLFKKDPVYKVKIYTILRYWNELVIPNSQVEKLEETGVLESGENQGL